MGLSQQNKLLGGILHVRKEGIKKERNKLARNSMTWQNYTEMNKEKQPCQDWGFIFVPKSFRSTEFLSVLYYTVSTTHSA